MNLQSQLLGGFGIRARSGSSPQMTIPVDAILEQLNTTYPCREAQFSALFSAIGHSSFPSPPAVCLTGFPATGKSSITRAFLEAMNIEYVWVDCSETISCALLFDRIVNKLRGLKTLPRLKMAADINNFIVEVHRALDELDGKVILVLPLKASELTEVGP